jgi:tetratricopeptide (TPR) repeat protein
VALLLGLVTLSLYLPALHNSFVDYDDQQYVTDNPRVQAGLTWHGLVWAFGFYAGNWHPLTWLSHMLDSQIYGARAWGHHLTSAMLHAASTALLFLALAALTRPSVTLSHRMGEGRGEGIWRCAAVAALFGWHPLHVESVAWVAERKDVLCAFFWMLTMLCYAKAVTSDQWQAMSKNSSPITRHSSLYCLALLFFALALMSKPMAVTLPFVLLLLDYWPLKRVPDFKFRISNLWQLIGEKIVFFILSAAGCVLTLRAQQEAIVSTAGLSVTQRIAHTVAAYNHYLAAMFFPRDLAVYYPYQIHLPPAQIWLGGMVLAVITLLAIKNLRSRPYLIVGWLWYLGTLVPVIGLVQVGDQAWADRYTYLPLIGPFLAVVWLAADVIKSRHVLQVGSAIVAAVLLVLTWRQIGYWQNTRTLFERAEQVTPNNYMAITMLGSLLAQEKKYDEAMANYDEALRIQPTFPEAHFFKGAVLDEEGRLDEAIAEYQQALWFKPTQEQTHIFMGIALGKQKKYDEAMAHYHAALKLNPDSAIAENNLARILHTLGRQDEAAEHYRAALEIDPKLALARNNLGILLIQRGDLAGGTVQLREAMRLNPTNAETQLNLAFALNQQQQWPEAAELFSKNVRDLPDAKAHYEYAVALGHLKQTQEAMSQYAAAILIQPDFPDALDGLAWIICTDTNRDLRNGAEAVKMATRACDLTGNQDPEKLKTLAAAYAETGQFEQAIKTLLAAKDLATKANRPELVRECALMLEQFQKTQPWRSP